MLLFVIGCYVVGDGDIFVVIVSVGVVVVGCVEVARCWLVVVVVDFIFVVVVDAGLVISMLCVL